MPKIEPTHVKAALKTALKDGEVTADEVKNKIEPAALRDLASSDNPKETLRLAAENLARFLEPFRANDSQQENGVLLARSDRYSLTDLADTLTKAAEQLDQIKGGVFGAAFGLAMEDGSVSVTEVKHLQSAAKKVMEGAADPAAAARTMRGMLLEVEAMLAQTAMFGGGSRDEVFSPESSQALGKLNALLGKAIAKGLQGGTDEKVDPDGTFAKGVKDILSADGMGRGLVIAALPSLVDQEVSMFNADGLTGPAKLKMEQQAEKRAGALLSYVDGLPGGSDNDDVKHTLFRLVTGKYVPPAAASQFKAELESVDVGDLHGAVKGLQKERDAQKGTSFTANNQRKALTDGIALIQAELERRGVGAVGSGAHAPAAGPTAKAVLAYLRADADIAAILAEGGTLKDDSVKVFTWSEARDAIKKDFGAGTNLDTVLQNMTQANMLGSDMPKQFAFARVAIDIPNDGPFPLTVVLKKDGADWSPVRRADGGIPFDS